MKIVIIEDDQVSVGLFKEYISSLGHEVVGVFSEAKSFFKFLEKNRDVDLVFIDILIEGKEDGIDLAISLRKKIENINIVFLTSHSDSKTISMAKKAKPDGYLIKPVEKSDFEAILMVVDTNDCCDINAQYIATYKYNKEDRLICKNNNLIKLSNKERICLDVLIKNKNNYVTIETLSSNIWEDENPNSTNSLRELIYRLRKKLPDLTIDSSSSIGYILKED